MKLTLQNLCEAFIIDLDRVLYFEADDHYTHVYMADGHKFMVPFGLMRIEAELVPLADYRISLQRLGRRHIVNMTRIFHINTTKQAILLSDNRGNVHTVQVSKAVLRQLLDRIEQGE